MKNMIPYLLALIFGSGLARATPIVVMEAPVNGDERVAATFDVDKKLGRAWIDIELTDSRFETSIPIGTVLKKVDGLYYDSGLKQVLYRQGDHPIVCAQETSFLGIAAMKTTGNCPLLVSSEERTVDDGFHLRKQTFVKVTLDPQA